MSAAVDGLAVFNEGRRREREFAASALARRFTVEQWRARCAHLVEQAEMWAVRGDVEQVIQRYGRLAVASYILEGIENP